MAPKGVQRCLKLPCQPNEEFNYLGRLAKQCERESKILHARDALRDLYPFDPGNSEVFRKARELERHPLFQPQLKSQIAQWRRSHTPAT